MSLKKKEKIREFTGMTQQALRNVLTEKKEHLRQLRFDLSGGKVKNVKEIRQIRKDIARIETIIKSKNK